MVAQTVELPNVRKLFIPDPGYYIGEVDLVGSEAQIIAWDAGDEDLKAAFRAGLNVHIKNARDVFPERVKGWSDEAIKATDMAGGVYYICKRCVHATHNGGRPPGLSREIGISVKEAEDFQRTWYGLHPKIKLREEYILDCLNGRIEGIPARTIYNKFGYRIVFFDRHKQVFTEALTWIQQSTSGICCFKGGLALRKYVPWVELLLQVHDSLVFQFKLKYLHRLGEIKSALETIIVPYDDPLCIPWSLKLSLKSWGDAEDMKWEEVPGIPNSG